MNAILGVALAMVFGLILNRVMKLFNLPNVTGYLIAGILVGPYCINLLSADNLSDISFISTIALGFIAFSIGGEFKIDSIKRLGGKVLTITFLQAFGAVALVMSSLFVVQAIDPTLISTPAILLLSAIATATAPAATLMVVRQYKAKGPVTETLLPVVAFDDAIGLIVFAICFGVAKVLAGGGEITAKAIALNPLLEIVLSLGIGCVLGIILAFVCNLFKSRANRLSAMVATVLIAVGLCQIEILGVHMSSLLICMMVGAAFTNARKDAVIILDGQERWTPPLFMLFFVISGATLDLTIIPYIGVIGVVYIVFRSLGKYSGAFLGGLV
ncbi:MAG: cation:proton antiporter, partial [Clostridia bacterium]|nr:cation:proton antiporter [Clostridia bacterium]